MDEGSSSRSLWWESEIELYISSAAYICKERQNNNYYAW